jgi:PAS domain S-box-containing protein
MTVNQAAVAQYGFSLDAFLSMTLFDICPETECEPLKSWLSESNRAECLHWLHQRKNGTVFPAKALSKPIQYNNRDARFVLALDMTAQVKAEQDVQEYLYTLQRATDAAQAITFHQTLDGTMREVVDQARGVIGAHQAVLTLSASDGVHAVHAVSLSEKYSSYRDRLEPIHGLGILAMVCGNNRPLRLTQAELEAHPDWVNPATDINALPDVRGCLAVPLIGRNNKNIGMLQLSDRYEGDFTMQDEYVAIEMAQLVSIAIENAQLLEQVNQLNTGLEKKVAERTAALTRQEALFRALAEQAPQVVWTADVEGRVTFLNQAWFDLAGGEMSDWLGTRWFRVVHPDDLPQVRASWQTAVADLVPYVGIRRVLSVDGSYHSMSYRASPVHDEMGEVAFWVGIDADVSEIKAIETALRLSNQELEAFSYSVSHDLRSPLNTIDGFSRLLAKQLAPTLDDKGKHYLSRMQAGVAQMGQLIEDLLSLAQVSRGPLRAEPVDLTALAQIIMGERQASNPEREVNVRIEESLQAVGDGRLLRVVLENLLNNAWKFTVRVPRAEITVGQLDDAAGLPVFFVKDNGAGFDMAYADKLFTAFQRLHTTAEFPGTGIGLATASRIIIRHGGRLWADASPGKGATFFFTVPRLPTVVEQ